SRRRVVDPSGILFREGDQLGERVAGKTRRRRDDVRNFDQFRDAHQVTRRLDLQLMRERVFVDGVGGDVADEQGVAVGGRFRNGFQGEVARGARTVFHEDALAQGLGEFGGDDPGDDVGCAARGVGYEDLYRAGRKRVGRLRGGRER